MKTLTAVCILTLLAVPIRVRAGHELPYYPSFYPHEIRLEGADAPALRDALPAGRVHPRPGAETFGRAPPPGKAPAGPPGGSVVATLCRGGIPSTPPPA